MWNWIWVCPGSVWRKTFKRRSLWNCHTTFYGWFMEQCTCFRLHRSNPFELLEFYILISICTWSVYKGVQLFSIWHSIFNSITFSPQHRGDHRPCCNHNALWRRINFSTRIIHYSLRHRSIDISTNDQQHSLRHHRIRHCTIHCSSIDSRSNDTRCHHHNCPSYQYDNFKL